MIVGLRVDQGQGYPEDNSQNKNCCGSVSKGDQTFGTAIRADSHQTRPRGRFRGARRDRGRSHRCITPRQSSRSACTRVKNPTELSQHSSSVCSIPWDRDCPVEVPRPHFPGPLADVIRCRPQHAHRCWSHFYDVTRSTGWNLRCRSRRRLRQPHRREPRR